MKPMEQLPLPLNPVAAAWQFVATHFDRIERYAKKFCPPWMDFLEFQSTVQDDVYDAHARGKYKPNLGAPTTWIYQRARLCRTEAGRVRGRQLAREVSASNAVFTDDAGGVTRLIDVIPVGPRRWGSPESCEARVEVRWLIQAGNKSQQAACSTFLADRNRTKAGRQRTEKHLRRLGASLGA